VYGIDARAMLSDAVLAVHITAETPVVMHKVKEV
jgi:hypothetical protein